MTRIGRISADSSSDERRQWNDSYRAADGGVMSRHWREEVDPDRHVDFMSTTHVGGMPVESPRDRLIQSWVYFVEVCSFTFQFHSIDQIRECLSHFEKKIHPSSRIPDVVFEHYWQRWYERLPGHLFQESKRLRVVRALENALAKFGEPEL